MSRLIAIRHAQASFLKADYDQLSDLGYEQANHLGHYLVEQGLQLDAIYVGPLKRHWQTLSRVQAAYAARGLSLPEPILIEELAEHEGMQVMMEMLPQLLEKHEIMKRWSDEADADERLRNKSFLRIFTLFMELWAKDELGLAQPPERQSWQDFRKMVRIGIGKILQADHRGATVAAFTSGGTIAASLGMALEIEKEHKVIELNGHVKNTSMTEFLFSKNKFTLKTFNEIPHLVQKEMVTYV